MACDAAKKYIQDELAKGTTQFARSNSMVQDLIRSNNLKEIQDFIKSTDLMSRLYD